jgi:exo-beta-1,3-glucanase (GH17 family)
MRKFIFILKMFVILFIVSYYFLSCSSQEVVIDLTKQAWYGNAISYSGYREGQNPQKYIYPSQAEVLEDLRILERNWELIRTYGADKHSEDILQVISREKINLKVMLGAWLDGEPGNEAANSQQINNCIRLANEYGDVVIAVNVGNEILVHWSNHKVPEDEVIQYVRQVQQAVQVPVTVADDFMYWRDHGGKLAGVVDFVTMHTYPVWGRQDIDTAMLSTISTYESVKKALPDKTVIIGEAGWPSYTEGEFHAPQAGDEKKQKRYYQELHAWAEKNQVTVFYFEAFDEPWKGKGTEGHWGLFTEGRKAKPVMQVMYPDLMPDGPTSPAYKEGQGM